MIDYVKSQTNKQTNKETKKQKERTEANKPLHTINLDAFTKISGNK